MEENRKIRRRPRKQSRWDSNKMQQAEQHHRVPSFVSDSGHSPSDFVMQTPEMIGSYRPQLATVIPVMGTYGPSMEPPGPSMGPTGQHMGSYEQHMGPSGEHMESPVQHMGLSGQDMGPHGPGIEPSWQYMGPSGSGQNMGPSGQHMGSSGQNMGPPGQNMGPSGQHMGSSGQYMGPPGQNMGPPGQNMGPPGQNMGPPGQNMGPPGQNMGPPGQNMGPPGQNMGPPGQNMGPPGQNMGPPGQNMGPSGQHMGSSGQNMGPPGQNMGPSGQHMGSSGQYMGNPRQHIVPPVPAMEPFRQHMGPPGQQIGPSGQQIGHSGQHMGPQGPGMGPPGQHIGPSVHHMGPSVQQMELSVQQMGPFGQNMGPSGQQIGPSGQQIGPSGQHMGPPGPGMGPPGQHIGPSVQHMGSSVQQMGPFGQHMGPSVQQMGPSVQQMGPSGQHMGPPGPGMGPPGPGILPPGQHIVPPVPAMEPFREHMGPSVQHMGPSGQHMGPSGQHIGPSLQHIGPSVQHTEPLGQHIGPSGQQIGPPRPDMGPHEQHIKPSGQTMGSPGPSIGPTVPNTGSLGLSGSQMGYPGMPPIPQQVKPVIPNYSVPKPNLHPVNQPADNLWVKTTSPKGEVYYYNTKTRMSFWERPQNVSIVTQTELEIAHNAAKTERNLAMEASPAQTSVQPNAAKDVKTGSEPVIPNYSVPIPNLQPVKPVNQPADNLWVKNISPTGEVYYYNTKTRMSFWERPHIVSNVAQTELEIAHNTSKGPTKTAFSVERNLASEASQAQTKRNLATEASQAQTSVQQNAAKDVKADSEKKKKQPKIIEEKKPESKAEQKPEPVAEKKQESKAEQKPEPVAEKKQESKAAQKPEPVAEKKPESQAPEAEQKPESKAEQKPVTKSKPVTSTPIPDTVWRVVQTNDGKHFFYNTTKRQSVWKMPEELKNRPDVDKLLPPKPEVKIEIKEEKDLQEPPSKKIKLEAEVKEEKEESSNGVTQQILEKEATNAVKVQAAENMPVVSIEDRKKKFEEPHRLEVEVKEEKEESSSEATQEIVLEKESTNAVEVQAAENMPVVSLEDRKKQFKELLAEKHVKTPSTWEEELHKVVFDKRYMLLSLQESKQVFEDYMKERIEEERQKRYHIKENSELYRQSFEESNVIVKLEVEVKEEKEESNNEATQEIVFEKETINAVKVEAAENMAVSLEDRKMQFKEPLAEKDVSTPSPLQPPQKRELTFAEIVKKRAEEARMKRYRQIEGNSELFIQLLEESNLHANSTFESFEDAHSHDERFGMVRYFRDRKYIFHDYISKLAQKKKETFVSTREKVLTPSAPPTPQKRKLPFADIVKNRADKERMKIYRQMEGNSELFIQLLEESNLNANSTFESFEDAHSHDERFGMVPFFREKKYLFQDYITELAQQENETFAPIRKKVSTSSALQPPHKLRQAFADFEKYRAEKERMKIYRQIEGNSELFIQLLEKSNLNANSTFESFEDEHSHDERFGMVRYFRDRKYIFHYYIGQLAQQENETFASIIKKGSTPSELFRELLEESNLHANSSFESFEDMHSHDERFGMVHFFRDKKILFQDYITELALQEREKYAFRREQGSTPSDLFRELLEESNLNANSTFQSFKNAHSHDERFRMVRYFRDKKILFQDYIHELVQQEREMNGLMREEVHYAVSTPSELFRELLEESNLNANSSFESFEVAHSHDERFGMVHFFRDKKILFQEYINELAQQEREMNGLMREEGSTPSELFRQLLEESNLNAKSSFQSFVISHSHDERFGMVPRFREKKYMFQDYISELEQQEKETFASIKTKVKNDFMKMLSETPGIAHDTLWRNVRRKLYLDPRYKAVDLASRRETWFFEYLETENDVKHEFLKLLRELPDIDLSTSWSDVKNKVSSDPRYKAISDTRQKEWFETYLKTVKDVTSDDIRKEEVQEKQLHSSSLKRKNASMQNPRDAAIKDFKQFLVEKVKDTKELFSTFTARFCKSARWTTELSYEEKKTLYVNHVYAIHTKNREIQRPILDEMDVTSDDKRKEEVREKRLHSHSLKMKNTTLQKNRDAAIKDFKQFLVEKVKDPKELFYNFEARFCNSARWTLELSWEEKKTLYINHVFAIRKKNRDILDEKDVASDDMRKEEVQEKRLHSSSLKRTNASCLNRDASCLNRDAAFEDFKQFLVEKVKDTKNRKFATFEARFCKSSRWTMELSESEKRKLYHNHVSAIHKKNLEILGSILDDMNFPLEAAWSEKGRKRVQADPRFVNYTDSEEQLVLDYARCFYKKNLKPEKNCSSQSSATQKKGKEVYSSW